MYGVTTQISVCKDQPFPADADLYSRETIAGLATTWGQDDNAEHLDCRFFITLE